MLLAEFGRRHNERLTEERRQFWDIKIPAMMRRAFFDAASRPPEEYSRWMQALVPYDTSACAGSGFGEVCEHPARSAAATS